MSKGFVDHVIYMALLIDREIKRELDGVEWPLFKDRYFEWLADEPKSKVGMSSQVNYKRWLFKADEWVLDTTHDLYTLLKNAWKQSDFERVTSLCDDYEMQLLADKALAEKEDIGESSTEIGNWISAFRKYRAFLKECMEQAEVDKRVQDALIKSARATAAEHLPLKYDFYFWGIAKGKSEKTMKSYVSDIKRVNKDLFCKTGHDMLSEFLPGFIKTGNKEKTVEMFTKMDDKLTERIDYDPDDIMSPEALGNCRSALRKYAEFIISRMEDK